MRISVYLSFRSAECACRSMSSCAGSSSICFSPGIEFDSLSELNRQALVWCGEVNRRVHSTTREIPQLRFPHEGLAPLNDQPVYDTSPMSLQSERLLNHMLRLRLSHLTQLLRSHRRRGIDQEPALSGLPRTDARDREPGQAHSQRQAEDTVGALPLQQGTGPVRLRLPARGR